MRLFEHQQRVVASNVTRIERSRGAEAARWLLNRAGVVLALATDGGAWVRMDEPLPAALRGVYPDSHPLGRSILLFPHECQPAHDRGYAPFHREEFAGALDAARREFDQRYLLPPADPTRPERAWWRDVTNEKRQRSAVGLWEHVYRFGVEQRKVTLLVYSTVNTESGWSRPASSDAIRFVHEVRRPEERYLDTGTRVNRTGAAPLDRVVDRVLELMAPPHVADLARNTWSRQAFARGRAPT